MATIILRKRLGGSLEPTDDMGREALRKIAIGAVVKCDITKPRNIHFHRKFFAMLQLIFENQDWYKSPEQLLEVCKHRIGHVEVIKTKHGEVTRSKSISFAQMDELAFSDFYDRAVNWMIEEVIPGLKRSDLDGEIAQQLMEFA